MPVWLNLIAFLGFGLVCGFVVWRWQRAVNAADHANLRARNAEEKLAELGAVAVDEQYRGERNLHVVEGGLARERKARAEAVRTDADAADLLRDELSPTADPDDPTDPGLPGPPATPTPTGRKPGGVN